MRTFERAARAIGLCCVAVIVAACGTGQQAGGPASGTVDGLVDVGDGRSIYAKCAGQGSPTVVLIAGKGNGAQDWQDVLVPGDPAHDTPGDDIPWGMGTLEPSDDAVFPSTARFTRVCTYDRPDVRTEGPDVSTPRPQPHTVDQDVDDLHALLTTLGEPPPYVLVAHSYGGLIANLFARTYPETIGGLVMVDTVTPRIQDVTSAVRLVNWDAANATTSPQVREGVRLVDAFEKIAAAPPLPRVPAVVLSADKPWRTDLLPAEVAAIETVTFEQWLAALDLLAQDLGAQNITVTDSGHDIYLYNPALVTEQIGRIVDDASSGDIAGTVDIGGGRQLYVECRGTGSPTVVLESGLDVAGDLWDSPLGPAPHVFPAVAEQTRVCTYDRPGTTRAIAGGGNSRSDPVPQPTTTADAVADLHALITTLQITDPVVLVGHSYAGVISRLYAATYPDQVFGMVLVDALAPELRANMTAEQYSAWKTMNERTPEQIADYPDLERIEFDASLDQLADAPPILQMPLIVITADHPMAPSADLAWIDAAHQAAQAQLAALVEGAEHVTAHGGHNVMIDDAPAVIGAIDDVVDAVRAGRTAV